MTSRWCESSSGRQRRRRVGARRRWRARRVEGTPSRRRGGRRGSRTTEMGNHSRRRGRRFVVSPRDRARASARHLRRGRGRSSASTASSARTRGRRDGRVRARRIVAHVSAWNYPHLSPRTSPPRARRRRRRVAQPSETTPSVGASSDSSRRGVPTAAPDVPAVPPDARASSAAGALAFRARDVHASRSRGAA